jgi:hypothetical protein
MIEDKKYLESAEEIFQPVLIMKTGNPKKIRGVQDKHLAYNQGLKALSKHPQATEMILYKVTVKRSPIVIIKAKDVR